MMEKQQREDSLLLLTSATSKQKKSSGALTNFIRFSLLFSASPCCVLSCMALATARLGAIGAWQSGILYATYTLSSLTGATYVVKVYGARNSILAGMVLYVLYVGCFIVATEASMSVLAAPVALFGAAMGGVGGGLLWTAQGVYFSQAAENYVASGSTTMSLSDATSYLAGIFAAIYLAMEALLELLPTLLIQAGIVSWTTIFGVYSVIAVLATVGMLGVVEDYSTTSVEPPPTTTTKYSSDESFTQHTSNVSTTAAASSSWQQKLLAAWHLLRDDTKLKYLVGLNAAFGFSGAFVHSFVNGEVVRLVLQDDQSKYVGALSAWSAIVSSGMSLVFDYWSRRLSNQGAVQIVGCCAYLCIVLPFLLFPDLTGEDGPWGWGLLLLVYFMYGAGRSTFEGSLKAIFADFFPHEKEGAYSNIVLQSGLTSTVGFIVTYCGLPCSNESSSYCILYKDDTHHNVLVLELAVAITSILAIFGYLRAAQIFEREQKERATME